VTLAAALLVVAAVAAGDVPQLRIDPQIALWLEEDTNPKRLPDVPVDDDDGDLDQNVADGLVRFAATVNVDASGAGRVLRLDTALGGKLFFAAATERMLVAQSRAVFASAVDADTVVVTSASGKLRGQVSGQRSYGNFRGDIGLERGVVDGAVDVAVKGGVDGSSFLAFDNPTFSFAGGGAFVGARVVDDKERLDVVGSAGLRGYPFASLGGDERRVDTPLLLAVTATSARRIYLSGTYVLTRNDSSARGESYTRHRVQLTSGARLPAQVTATAQLALQLTRYDDGLSLAQRYFLADDDETQNLVELAIARPLFAGLSLEARTSFLSNELAQGGARFSRVTAAVGVRADLW
jgi:hypothetical protein